MTRRPPRTNLTETLFPYTTHFRCLGLAGYLYSLDYVKQRPQGRAPYNKDPASKPLPIIQHADIRRLLLSQKAAVEGSLALCLYAASLVDRIHTAEDEGEKTRLSLLLDMLTPMVKSWPSEFCLEANKQAIQILGGRSEEHKSELTSLMRISYAVFCL